MVLLKYSDVQQQSEPTSVPTLTKPTEATGPHLSQQSDFSLSLPPACSSVWRLLSYLQASADVSEPDPTRLGRTRSRVPEENADTQNCPSTRTHPRKKVWLNLIIAEIFVMFLVFPFFIFGKTCVDSHPLVSLLM